MKVSFIKKQKAVFFFKTITLIVLILSVQVALPVTAAPKSSFFSCQRYFLIENILGAMTLEEKNSLSLLSAKYVEASSLQDSNRDLFAQINKSVLALVHRLQQRGVADAQVGVSALFSELARKSQIDFTDIFREQNQSRFLREELKVKQAELPRLRAILDKDLEKALKEFPDEFLPKSILREYESLEVNSVFAQSCSRTGSLLPYYLIKYHSADINASALGAPALLRAVEAENVNLVRLLLLMGANPNATSLSYFADTALKYAMLKSNEFLMNLLIQYKANVNQRGYALETPLTFAVKEWNGRVNENKIRILIQANADINLMDRNGDTPLMIATRKQKIDLMHYFLSSNLGTKIDLENSSGDLPLEMAIYTKNVEAVALLLSFGASPTSTYISGRSILKAAKSSGNPEILRLIKEALDSQRSILNEPWYKRILKLFRS